MVVCDTTVLQNAVTRVVAERRSTQFQFVNDFLLVCQHAVASRFETGKSHLCLMVVGIIILEIQRYVSH